MGIVNNAEYSSRHGTAQTIRYFSNNHFFYYYRIKKKKNQRAIQLIFFVVNIFCSKFFFFFYSVLSKITVKFEKLHLIGMVVDWYRNAVWNFWWIRFTRNNKYIRTHIHTYKETHHCKQLLEQTKIQLRPSKKLLYFILFLKRSNSGYPLQWKRLFDIFYTTKVS